MSLFDSVMSHSPAATLTSDASGSWGCGAFTTGGHWFQFQWPEVREAVHVKAKELLPIVVAYAVWGQDWTGKTVHC